MENQDIMQVFYDRKISAEFIETFFGRFILLKNGIIDIQNSGYIVTHKPTGAESMQKTLNEAIEAYLQACYDSGDNGFSEDFQQ